MTFFTLYNKHRHQGEAFTLIEILLVVAVMLITLAFATPIFSGLIRGNAVDHATSIVTSQLALARAAAVRNSRTVALVFPIENQADHTLAYTTCRPCFVTWKDKDISTEDIIPEHWEFHRWLPNSAWAQLPLGAVIIQVNDDCNEELIYNDNPQNNESTWTVQPTWLDPKHTIQPNQDADGIENVKLTPDAEGEAVRAILFFPDGSSPKSMYVTILQGNTFLQGDATKLGKPDPNRLNRDNLRVIRINPFTGKAGVIY